MADVARLFTDAVSGRRPRSEIALDARGPPRLDAVQLAVTNGLLLAIDVGLLGHVVAESLERLSPNIRRAIAAGGGAQSAIWRQIVADLAGLELRHDRRVSATLGGAILAAFGLNGVDSLDHAAAGWLADEEASFHRLDPIAATTYAGERLAWQVYGRALMPS